MVVKWYFIIFMLGLFSPTCFSNFGPRRSTLLFNPTYGRPLSRFNWQKPLHPRRPFHVEPASYSESMEDSHEDDPFENANRALNEIEEDLNSGISGRIVGGKSALPGEIPHQLYLAQDFVREGKRLTCGASLIEVYGIQCALTAAHCVWGEGHPDRFATVPLDKLTVAAGDINIAKKEKNQQTRTPNYIVMHEQYDMDEHTPHNDLAIVFYKQPFKKSVDVSPILLPEYKWEQPESCLISGWGSTTSKENPDYPLNLQVAWISVMPKSRCVKYGFHGNVINWKQFCLLSTNNKGACIGDSGGPAASRNKTNGRWYLSGVTSYVIDECASRYYPTVFSLVSAQIDWIRIKVNEYIDHEGWPV